MQNDKRGISAHLRRFGPIGIGCAYLTAGSITNYDARLIGVALDEGARHFDVAPNYGLGTAESVLGRLLHSRRNDVCIVTKVGIPRPEVHPTVLFARSLAAPVRKLLRARGLAGRISQSVVKGQRPIFSPDYITDSVEQSLRSLRTSYIDALLLHMVELADVDSQILEALYQLRKSGKVLAVGLATSVEQTTSITTSYPGMFDVVQHPWSLLTPHVSFSDPGLAYVITHGSLISTLRPLQTWLSEDSARTKFLSAQCNLDLLDPNVLAQALLGASLAHNKDGTVLVASREIQRTRENIRSALSPSTLDAGRRLMLALAQQCLPFSDFRT